MLTFNNKMVWQKGKKHLLYEVGEENETQLESTRIDNPITQVENLSGR